MSAALPTPSRALLQGALLCLLVLGLLLQARAAMLVHLLGAAHWHATAVAAPNPAPSSARLQPQGLGQRWSDLVHTWRHHGLGTSALGAGRGLPVHHHDSSQRHHHSPGEATVVTLEPTHGATPAGPDTGAGSLLQPQALAGPLAVCMRRDGATRWPVVATSGWRDAAARLPERPPRA